LAAAKLTESKMQLAALRVKLTMGWRAAPSVRP